MAETILWRGRVDGVIDGVAFVTLVHPDGRETWCDWDAGELAEHGIDDLFTLEVTDGKPSTVVLRREERKPLPEELVREIERLQNHYRATGEWEDETDG